VRAILLAAGVARRLAPLTDRTQKCLLRVGGRSLLDRMLDALAGHGIDEAVIVVGHCQAEVRAAGGTRRGRMAIRYIENPDYRKGSALSLWHARAVLAEDATLVMDADVLFPPVFLARLLAAPAASALLLDRAFSDSGEEVKLYGIGDRVIALGKKIVPERWEVVGEGVGFFKCSPAHGPAYARRLDAAVRATGGHSEYEDALHELLQEVPVGWVDVTGLPWTEVDFVEDLRRAEAEVLPRIAHLAE
jgi:L-glutamine-phosphate cytidylyltransferase